MVDGTRRLHELGIAHLDLKLENMLLSAESSDATLMISDFGLSEKVGSTGWCDYRDHRAYVQRALLAAGGGLSERLRRQ